MALTWTGKTKVYVISYANRSLFPTFGSTDTIYIDDNVNAIYWWNGLTYEELGQYPIVDKYADLPTMPNPDYNGKIYVVTTSTGIWPLNHPAGLYISNGVTWTQIPATAGAITYGDLYATSPITYDGAGTYGLNYNTTNLKLTSDALNTIQDIALTSSPQFLGLNLSGLVENQAVVTDASKNLASLGYTSSNVANTLIQRDYTGSFAAQKATLSDLVVGPSQSAVLSNKIIFLGPNADMAGPHIIAYTAADAYPLYQQLNWAHDNIAQNFDCYYDGIAYRSSVGSGSNFQISKVSNQFQYNYSTSVIAGAPITFTNAGHIDCTTGVLNWQKIAKFNDTTDSTSITSGSIVTLGGAAIAKNLTLAGDLNSYGANQINFYTDSGSTLRGYVGCGRNNDFTVKAPSVYTWFRIGSNNGPIQFWMNNNVDVNDAPQISFSTLGGISTVDTTNSTSVGTGSIVSPGGASFAKNVYIGSNINVAGLTASYLVATDASKNLTSVAIGEGLTLTAGTLSSTSSGNVNAGTANQLAFYSAAGTTISGTSFFKDYGTASATTIGGNLFAGNSSGNSSITNNPCNTGFGIQCLSSITSATSTGKNSAFGFKALWNLTLGSENTAVGFNAGITATSTSSSNSLFGANAGDSFVQMNQCTIIGANADIANNNLTNATALGYAASESESNSITLGNTSVTKIKTTGALIFNGPTSGPIIPTLINAYSTTQNLARLTLTGQEFYEAAKTSTDGLSMILGVNRPGNRQLWITDSSFAINSTNAAFRVIITPGYTTIGTTSTDGNFNLPTNIATLNLGINSMGFGGGVGVVSLNNASTIPTFSSAGGVLIYAQSGALKARGSSGTITTMANADPHCPVCNTDYVNEWENDNYGYLAVCMNCYANDNKSFTRVKGKWNTHS